MKRLIKWAAAAAVVFLFATALAEVGVRVGTGNSWAAKNTAPRPKSVTNGNTWHGFDAQGQGWSGGRP